MSDQFKHIKVVGFDMDGTLYKSLPEMDERIIREAGKKVLEKNPDLGSIEEAIEVYSKRSKELESGMRTLKEFGYGENAPKVMAKVLEDADITDLIPEDEVLAEIIEEITKKYFTYILSTSPRVRGERKLKKIGINIDSFNKIIFGDDPWMLGNPKKIAYEHILEETGMPPEEHVYVGDRKMSDILGPQSLGMKTISVWKEIPEADVSISHIHKIKNLLL